ncbi:DUF2690 domain-containing protein [Streptomyces sp. NPDC090132]|uniref:DUF2690 domain-containing protein n=1 Tax=Streptomyces sp. NPDC090132 TaxID=3365955 RepID=UPI0037FB3001
MRRQARPYGRQRHRRRERRRGALQRALRAAWARITKAAAGDVVRISAGGAGQDGKVSTALDTYTPMVAVKRVADVKACTTLATGTKGCTAEAAG